MITTSTAPDWKLFHQTPPERQYHISVNDLLLWRKHYLEMALQLQQTAQARVRRMGRIDARAGEWLAAVAYYKQRAHLMHWMIQERKREEKGASERINTVPMTGTPRP